MKFKVPLSTASRTRTALFVFALAACGLAAAGQIVKTYVAEVTKDYTFPNDTKIALEGVCSYDEKGVSCWDSSGTASPSLSEAIRGYYSRENGRELSFRLGKKNRMVVFSSTARGVDFQIKMPDGNFCQTERLFPDQEGPHLSWAMVSVPEEKSTMGLVVMAQGLPGDEPVKAAFTEGTTFTFDNFTFQVAGSKTAPADEVGRQAYWARNADGLKFWNCFLILKAKGKPTGHHFFTVLDKQGNTIKYVDRNGKVISEIAYVKEYPNGGPFRNGEPSKQKYFPMQFDITTNQGMARAFLTNVDPAEVGYIQISGNKQSGVLFKDIRLDPK